MPSKRPPPPESSSSSSSSSGSSESEGEEEKEMIPLPPKSTTKTNSAPKRPIPLQQTHDSSTEEEEDGEEESDSEEEDSSEKEVGGNRSSKPLLTLNPPPKPKDSEPSSSDNDGSDSESDSSGKHTPPRPPPSRSTDPTLNPETPESEKPETVESKKPAVARTEKGKRKVPEASGDTEEHETATNGPSEKKPFQPVWTPEDQIAVLKGMIEYQAKYNSDPSNNRHTQDILELTKDSLHMDYTKSQLYEKIRRIRGKYNRNMARGKNGADPHFPKPQDQMIFDLSKQIWGTKKAAVKDAASGEMEQNVGVRNNSMLYPTLHGIVAHLENSTGNGLYKGTINLITPSRGKVLEEKWKRQCVEEMKLRAKRSDLVKELDDAIIEALGYPTS